MGAKGESVPKKIGVMSACKSKLMIDVMWGLVNGHQAEGDCCPYMMYMDASKTQQAVSVIDDLSPRDGTSACFRK